MASNKKYFHDHLVLLLLSVNGFLAVAASIFILVKLGSSHSSSYIVQCRDCSNLSATNRFSTGSVVDLLSFVAFAVIVMITHTMLSLRAYRVHRQLAIAILGLGTLLLVLTIIVSNALLVLR